MKATPSAPFSELRGKLGALAGQKRKSGNALVLLSVPYAKSGEDRSEAQQENMSLYADAIQDWKEATEADKERWALAGEALAWSAWDWLVHIEIDSRYGESEYGIGHYQEE
ncbi:MAG: hypothetical protein Q8J76_07810 [Desulfobulbaceae bacterium]|nr:hypothetical protein [Desulfobulbaceae bacterium]